MMSLNEELISEGPRKRRVSRWLDEEMVWMGEYRFCYSVRYNGITPYISVIHLPGGGQVRPEDLYKLAAGRKIKLPDKIRTHSD